MTRAQKNLRFGLRVVWLLFKSFVLVAILILAAAVGAFYYVPHFITGETAKGVVAQRLQEVLHRRVQIDRLILTPQGIKLKGVRIFDNGEGAAPLLESDSALVTIRLPALAQRRLEISHVRVSGPRIHLSRDAAGRWNIADIFVSSASAPAAAPGGFPLTVSLAAEQTAIEDGTITVDDHAKSASYSLSRVNMTVRRFDIDNPFAFSLSLRDSARWRGRAVPVDLSAQGVVSLAGLNWTQAFLRADKLEVSADGRPVRGSLTLAGFVQPSMDLDLSLPPLGPDVWTAYLGRPLELRVPSARVSAHLEWPQPRFLRVTQLRLSAPPVSASASGAIDLTGDGPKADADLSVDGFPLASAATLRPSLSRFAMDGMVSGEVSVTAEPDHLSVHKIHLSARAMKGKFGRALVEGGDVEATATDDFSRWLIQASHGSVRAYENLFADVGLSLSLARNDLKVPRLAFKWGDSRVRLVGRVEKVSDPKEVEISGHIDRLRWERTQSLIETIVASVSTRTWTSQAEAPEAARKPWVRIFKYAIPKHFPDTVGHISIGETIHRNFSFRNADVMWDLQGVTPTLRRVSGDIRVGFGPGQVSDIQAVQSANKFLRIVFLPYIYMHKMNSLSVLSAATAYPTSLDFTRIEGQYGIRKGIVSTRFFHVDSPQLVAYADGTADFGRELVDMNILTRLTSYRAPLPEWWVDESGRPAIGFRVKGDLNQPELEPRLRKMASDEIEKALAGARGRAKKRFEAIEKLETLSTEEASTR